MPGTRTFIASLLWTACAAAQTNYLPLWPGNQWIYRADGPGQPWAFTVETGEAEEFNSTSYYPVRGFPSGELWLRSTDAGVILAWDPEAKQERVFARLDASEGERWPSGLPCTGDGTVASRAAKWSGPVGAWDNALEVKYAPNCADAGVESELWLPWLGLAQRTEQSIYGPRSYQLIYARLAGGIVLARPELLFSLSLDQAVYTAKETPASLLARVTIKSTADTPKRTWIGPSRSFGFVIRDEKGTEVYRWFDPRLFPDVISPFNLNGEKNWMLTVVLAGGDGKPLPDGFYTAEGNLLVSPGQPYTATVPFEIRSDH